MGVFARLTPELQIEVTRNLIAFFDDGGIARLAGAGYPLPVSLLDIAGAFTINVDTATITGFATLATAAKQTDIANAVALVSTGMATAAKQDEAIAVLGDAGDSAGAPTVIGLLKQIALNTTLTP